jgi:cytidylate kinase
MPASPPSTAPGAEPPPTRRLVVAVDGPSGSGKSSVSRAVAERLGLRYLDTGAMYRALTWWALDLGVDLTDGSTAQQVADLAHKLPLSISLQPATQNVTVDGHDVTAAIRDPRISAAVSAVATNLGVREELVRRQRDIAAEGAVVIEGRDITTVVAPDADVRVLLTADEAARLARRALEVHGSDDDDAIAATRDHVVRRDAQDSTVATFTEAADGVTVVDSSAMSFEETVAAVLALVDAAGAAHAAEGPS